MPLPRVLLAAALLLAAGEALAQPSTCNHIFIPPPGSPETAPETYVVRVHYETADDIRLLNRFDLWEFNNRQERYVLVAVRASELDDLLAVSLPTSVDAGLTARLAQTAVPEAAQVAGIPGFPCYRTVEETMAAAAQIALDHPDLATWSDIGDSWEKTAGLGGHDLMVLRLTNSAVGGPKPALVVTSSTHPREYTPVELSLRFAEHLVGLHGIDPEATFLLDHHEVHLVLLVNPDGRKHAETGLLWRKNTNTAYCGPTSDDRGADLNRNFEFEWDCCNGASNNPCDILYRGPSPASEPETQDIQAYLRSVFPDQRGPLLTDAAPADATGIFLDIHSFSRLVLWPWGFPGPAPNAAGLTALGRKFAFFNDYVPEQAIDLYPTDGTTLDFGYGDLGVASYTFELGTWFFQDCPTFENEILPDNLEALLYAAKASRAPYLLPSGPDTLDVTAAPAVVDAGTPVVIRARVDDDRFSRNKGVEPIQTLVAAEAHVDTPPWEPGAAPLPLGPADGAFDETAEHVGGVLDTSGLPPGRHMLLVRGQDASGSWGAPSAAFLYVADGSEATVSGTVTPPVATISADLLGPLTTTSSGTYSVRLPPGTWTLRATSAGHFPAVAAGVTGPATVDFVLDPAPPILLVDDDDDTPDVRAAYTDALDALGASYHVWETGNTDDEPDAATLELFDTVIWMTGDAFGGAAGPDLASESALGDWLERSGCLLISSQDYLWDRGMTAFMQNHLGLGLGLNDVEHDSALGAFTPFAGLGPYAFTYPYMNCSDELIPGATALQAFAGSDGDAGLVRDSGVFRASYWGFGLEVLTTPAERLEVLAAFLGWCADLPAADGDADGVANGADCAPGDPDAWAPPSAARDLTLDTTGALSWTPPLAPGGTTVQYDVLRLPATCLAGPADPAAPPLGEAFHYVIRSRNACGGTLATDSAGAARSVVPCF